MEPMIAFIAAEVKVTTGVVTLFIPFRTFAELAMLKETVRAGYLFD